MIKENILQKRLKSNNDLYNAISFIKGYCLNIHKDRYLIDFTDHGIDHSERIIAIIEKLCGKTLFKKNGKNSLNEIEIFILLASIFLHDIGMQINKDSVLKHFCKQYSLKYTKKTKNQFIRNYHHLLSKYWIDCNLKNSKLLPHAYFGDKELGKYIGIVVQSHGENFFEDEKYNINTSYKGQKIRIRILCALLSLGDALDSDCRRIDYEKLKYSHLNDISKMHWLKHYFVNSIIIDNNIIKLYYSFPQLTAHKSLIYRIYFSHLSLFWIKKNKQLFIDNLSDYGIVFEIKEYYEYNDTKDQLTALQYSYIEEEAANIVEQYYSHSNLISIPKFTVVIGILKRNNKVLLVKRKDQEDELSWQFPAGIVKPKNDLKKRLIDEFFDETGIKVSIKEIIGKRIHPNTKTICYYFSLNYIEGNAINGDTKENDEIQWVDIHEYKNYITSDIFYKVSDYLNKT